MTPQDKFRRSHLEYYRDYMRTWWATHPEAAQRNRERAAARRAAQAAFLTLCRITLD